MDPARAFEVAGRGLVLSRRTGHAERAGALAGNHGYAAILIGAWDEPQANLAEIEGAGGLSPWARAATLGPAVVVQAFQGRADPGLVEETLASFDAIASLQGRSIALAQAAMFEYASGRLDGVFRPAFASSEAGAAGGETTIAACMAARAVTWLQDVATMEAAAQLLRDLRWTRDLTALACRQLEGALMALDGRHAEATARYRDTLTAWRRLGMLPDIATAEMEMLLLLEDLPDRDELAADARRILTGLGAVTLLQRLDTVTTPRERVEVAR
jgi:hypothetical protein